MNSYAKTKELIDKVDYIVKKYNITDEDFKQDLFVLLLQQQKGIEPSVEQCNKELRDLILKQIENEISSYENKTEEIEELDESSLPYSSIDNQEICLKIDLENILNKCLSKKDCNSVRTYFRVIDGENVPDDIKVILSQLRNNKALREYFFKIL